MEVSSVIDQIVVRLFSERWVGGGVTKDVASMKNQLHKNLQNQLDGYWSGHTAYHIMVDGGFLIDAKSGAEKKVTLLGQTFMADFNSAN